MKRRNVLLALCTAITACGGGGDGPTATSTEAAPIESAPAVVIQPAAAAPAPVEAAPNGSQPIAQQGVDIDVLSGTAASITADPSTLVVDDFARPDRPLNGDQLATGEAWKVSGPGYKSASITSQRFTALENTYAYIDYAAPVTRLAGSFSFVPSGGANDDLTTMTLTLIADLHNTDGGLQTMLHLNFGPRSWALTKRLSGGPFIRIGSGSYTVNLDGTRYGIAMEIGTTTVTVVAPDGKKSTFTDGDIPSIAPQYAAFQIRPIANTPTARWDGGLRNR